MSVLFGDFETRSDVDLNKCGVEVYIESPHTEATMFAGAFDDGAVFGFLIVGNVPQCAPELWAKIRSHIAAGGTFVAHNAPFELAIWRMLHQRRPDIWPALTPEQTHCTMAMCRALSLPAKLELAAKALRLHVEKDVEGHKLMLKMCKPRKPRKGEPKDVLLWHETPEQLARELEYCKADIPPERAIWNLIPKLSERERTYWLIDRRINDRGIGIDLENVRVCQRAMVAEEDRLNNELATITGGYATSVNQGEKIIEWLADSSPRLPNLQRATVEAALDNKKDFPPGSPERRVLEIRQEGAKASTKKLKAMILGAAKDGRARGLLDYHGTSTGRPTGRRITPVNFIRPPESFEVEDAEDSFAWLKVRGGEDMIRLQHGSVSNAVSWSMRCQLLAAPGKVFRAVDYSNIEGRVLAWLAGEEWKLQAFRDYDAGKGHDLYKLAFGSSFGVNPADVTKEQRQIGKVQELALGYQGGHGAFLSMGKNYNIDLDKIAAAVNRAVTPATWEDAVFQYWQGARETAEEILAQRKIEAQIDQWNGQEVTEYEHDLFNLMSELAKANRYGLEQRHWVAVRIIVDGWRAANPAIVAYWRTLEKAAIAAVTSPGSIQAAGRIQYRVPLTSDGKPSEFLMCKLPSGRKIGYPYPRVVRTPSKFNREKLDTKLLFEGVDSKTKKWMTQAAYGGFLAENVTQATARCIQSDSHHRLEAANYPIILHVYDENVVEQYPNEGSLEGMCEIMKASEPWAAGLPVAVDGWEGRRYRK